jgi:DNA-binding transcriptional ArsR family regulator/anti-sigma regulatory factor (Ser/Thr protein kinase)
MPKANLSTPTRIAALLERGRPLSAAEIARRLKVAKPTVSRHLTAMIKDGRVVREGQGKRIKFRNGFASMALASDEVPTEKRDIRTPPPSPLSFVRRYPRAVISEDRVWQELQSLHPTLARLPAPARELFQYAFTEMLNNAIEHSGGREVEVRFAQASDDTLSFEILDDGVGLFQRLRDQLGLGSVDEAVKKLSQARLPAAPDGRAGAGLFFSSRAARRFEVDSNGFRWMVDNQTGNTAVAASEPRKGTRVRYQGELQPRRTLGDLFARYSEHTVVHKTRVVVTLGTSFISRKEAQRLLTPLERFHTVVLDFKDVKEIGQGFADEVFRVWPGSHPHVTLEPINMSPVVSLMVDHARRIR